MNPRLIGVAATALLALGGGSRLIYNEVRLASAVGITPAQERYRQNEATRASRLAIELAAAQGSISALETAVAAAESQAQGAERRVQTLTAELETARADFAEDQAEDARLQSLLRRTLELDPEEVSKLVAQASSELDRSTSLFEFTRVINDHYSVEQKQELVTNMWRVAYADGRLDKYEESLIRQVAELTYVPHTDYIRAKLVARA